MFIAPLFTIAKIWKPPRCLSIDEWINKLWNNQTMEYYSARKRNELSRHKKTWRKPKYIFLKEKRQSEKATCFIILTV